MTEEERDYCPINRRIMSMTEIRNCENLTGNQFCSKNSYLYCQPLRFHNSHLEETKVVGSWGHDLGFVLCTLFVEPKPTEQSSP